MFVFFANSLLVLHFVLNKNEEKKCEKNYKKLKEEN